MLDIRNPLALAMGRFSGLDIGDTINDGTVVWELVEESSGKGIDFYTVGESYEVGDIVIYSGNIYQCITAHTATSTFDNTKWEEVSKSGIPYYNQDTSYEVDDQVVYNNKIYKCVTAHTSTSTFDSTKWEELSSGGGISIWQANTEYEVNDVVIDSNLIWQCATAHISSTTFDESKWVCISGGEISNGYEIVTLWEGSLRFNDNTPQQLNDSISNYDLLLFNLGTGSNRGSSITELIDVKDLSSIAYYRLFGGHPNYNWQAEIRFSGSTQFYIDDYIERNSIVAYVYKVQGIRKAKPIVSSGMKYETLWSGSVGDISGIFVDVSINLSEPVTKFKKIGFEIVAKDDSGSTSYRNYYEEVPVEQIVNVISDSNQKLMFTLGYSSWSNYIMVNHSGTALSTLSMEGQRTLLTKIIGISEGVQIPTGVQAAKVTLWEGQGTQGQTLTLSDDLSNYDLITMYSTNNQAYVVAIGQIEPSKESTCYSSYYNGELFISVCDFSNNTATVTYASNLYVKRIVGIKYIQPDSYSTEEKLIGTWIDGKPLYKKTLIIEDISLPPSFTTVDTTFINLITGLKDIVNAFLIAKVLDYGNGMTSQTDYNIEADNSISVRQEWGNSTYRFTIYFTIEYTKN